MRVEFGSAAPSYSFAVGRRPSFPPVSWSVNERSGSAEVSDSSSASSPSGGLPGGLAAGAAVNSRSSTSSPLVTPAPAVMITGRLSASDWFSGCSANFAKIEFAWPADSWSGSSGRSAQTWAMSSGCAG